MNIFNSISVAFAIFLATITGFSCQSLGPFPKDCTDPSIVKDGEYTIYPDGVVPVRVKCDVARGGWTQLLNKIDRTIGPFNTTRIAYINGFGEPSSNFWLGLDNIRALVSSEPTVLRIELDNGKYWIEYDSFQIGSKSENYSLRLGSKTGGNLVDSFAFMKGNGFHTPDDDLTGCAKLYSAGWWFKACHSVCLTCEKSFSGPEGHWATDLVPADHWIIVPNAKMFIKPVSRRKPSNCYDLFKSGRTQNGVYNIYSDVSSDSSVQVYCEMGLGGWSRIMTRHTHLNYSFLKDYDAYKTGFGDILTNHWLGLTNMRSILRKEAYQLRIELSNSQLDDEFIVYDFFSIASEADHFRLKVGSKAYGELTDSLSHHSGSRFSTFDNDQDAEQINCALNFRAGWWFKGCYTACLTCTGSVWVHGETSYNNIKMLIRPNIL